MDNGYIRMIYGHGWRWLLSFNFKGGRGRGTGGPGRTLEIKALQAADEVYMRVSYIIDIILHKTIREPLSAFISLICTL